jgi:hypothetical protein
MVAERYRERRSADTEPAAGASTETTGDGSTSTGTANEAATSGSGSSGTGDASSEETRRRFDDAARDLSDQLNRAFTALGDTLRDGDAKERLKDAVKSLGDAVTLTVNETADEVRKRMRTGGSSDAGSDTTSGGSSDAGSDTTSGGSPSSTETTGDDETMPPAPSS